MLDQKSGQAAQKGQTKTFKACLRFQLQAPLAPCPGLPAHQRLLFRRQYFHMHLPVEGVAELATNQVCASLSPAPPDPRVFPRHMLCMMSNICVNRLRLQRLAWACPVVCPLIPQYPLLASRSSPAHSTRARLTWTTSGESAGRESLGSSVPSPGSCCW